MKQFETKLTVRIYDTKLVESLNTVFKLNKNRYQTKNQLIVELLERGINDKMKEYHTPPDSPAGAGAIPSMFIKKEEAAEMLKQLKDMLSDMQLFNKQHIGGLLAHLKMSERMTSCIYNILLAVATDEPITKMQVEIGYMDDVPKRFIDFLNSLLGTLFHYKDRDEGNGDSEDIAGVIS